MVSSDKPKAGSSIFDSGVLENLFDEVGEISSFGELMQVILKMLEEAGLFEKKDVEPQSIVANLGDILEDAAGQSEPKEALQKSLDEYIDGIAEDFDIDDGERLEMKSRLNKALDETDLSSVDWDNVSQDVLWAMDDVFTHSVSKTDGDSIQYGDPVEAGDIEFHDAETVSLYSLDENGHLDVSGKVSFADLKETLGEDFKVEVVKVESTDLKTGEEVVTNQGYYLSASNGAGFYLDANALDLADVDPEVVAAMDLVTDAAPSEPGLGSPGFKSDFSLGLDGPSPNLAA